MTISTRIFSSDAIANYFLKKRVLGTLTQLQIQKLVYISHGWHLALAEQPLIRDRVEAWKFGPVIPSLRREFAHFRSSPIDDYATEPGVVDGILTETTPTVQNEQPDYAKTILPLLDQIDKVYGNMTGPQLSTLTHQEGTPWYKVYKEQYKNTPPKGTHIPDELIRAHYKSLLKKSNQENSDG